MLIRNQSLFFNSFEEMHKAIMTCTSVENCLVECKEIDFFKTMALYMLKCRDCIFINYYDDKKDVHIANEKGEVFRVGDENYIITLTEKFDSYVLRQTRVDVEKNMFTVELSKDLKKVRDINL